MHVLLPFLFVFNYAERLYLIGCNVTGMRSENFSINVYSSVSSLKIMQRYQWLVLWLIRHYCLLNDYAALFLFCLIAISMDLLCFTSVENL